MEWVLCKPPSTRTAVMTSPRRVAQASGHGSPARQVLGPIIWAIPNICTPYCLILCHVPYSRMPILLSHDARVRQLQTLARQTCFDQSHQISSSTSRSFSLRSRILFHAQIRSFGSNSTPSYLWHSTAALTVAFLAHVKYNTSGYTPPYNLPVQPRAVIYVPVL